MSAACFYCIFGSGVVGRNCVYVLVYVVRRMCYYENRCFKGSEGFAWGCEVNVSYVVKMTGLI